MFKTPYHQEQLAEGLLYQKYMPHIHSFTFFDMKNETIDIAYEATKTLDQTYDAEGWHVQYLYVLEQVSYTPYVLRRVKDSIAGTPANLNESSAIVADTFLTKVLEAVLLPNVNLKAKQSLRFFNTEVEAFAWFDERRKAIGK